MGAIFGFIGDGDMSLLRQMGERLNHRGPAMRTWSPATGVYFGEREAGIAGGSTGADAIPLTVSATIYNRDAVLEQLQVSGRHVRGDRVQDTFLNAYEEFGTDCFAMFNGDFAIALWDARTRRLVLARDAMGARMLYYWHGQSCTAFATEYKALLAFADLKARPDLFALQHLQRTKYLPPGHTLLKDIQPVPAAHWLEVRRDKVEAQSFWRPELNLRSVTRQAAGQELQEIFLKAVSKRLAGPGRIGAELSGGIDSAAVVAAISKAHPDQPVKTFTIGSGPDDPEILGARLVSEHLRTEHHEVFAGPECLPEAVPEVVWHLEDPIARTETFLYYQLMKEACNDIDVVLGGYASDGLFAGLPRHKVLKLMQVVPAGQRALEEFYHYTQVSEPPRTVLGKVGKRIYYGKNDVLPPDIIGAPPAVVPTALPGQGPGLLNEVLLHGIRHGIPGWMPKVEKTHAAFGVEVRAPFLDLDLVRFSLELPENFKLRRSRDKYILRKALVPLLPREVVNRPKFPQRMDYDLKLSEVVEAMADDILSPEHVRRRGFFSEAAINKLHRRRPGKAYSQNQAMHLWTAIATELWARQFLDERGTRGTTSIGEQPFGRQAIC